MCMEGGSIGKIGYFVTQNEHTKKKKERNYFSQTIKRKRLNKFSLHPIVKEKKKPILEKITFPLAMLVRK